jgi:tetratricopeptide (TPR) repeat protein
MHLHHAALSYAPPVTAEEIAASEPVAATAFIRGTARLGLHEDSEAELDTTDFEMVASHAPSGGWSAVEATYYLSAIAAKKKGDAEEVRHWSDLHRRQIEAADTDEHTTAKLWSRYHRVRAFVPQLTRDQVGMSAEMDLAAEWAGKMSRDTAEREAESNVLSCALWESRTKEALVLGDLDLAEERVRLCITFAPLDPQPRLDLGHVLVERGDLEQAASAYRTAALNGPPAEVAMFMLGQCLEQLEDLEGARDAYVSALDLDPLGVSSLEQLVGVAERLDDRLLAGWASSRLHELGRAEADDLLPYQQYEGQLGVHAPS